MNNSIRYCAGILFVCIVSTNKINMFAFTFFTFFLKFRKFYDFPILRFRDRLTFFLFEILRDFHTLKTKSNLKIPQNNTVYNSHILYTSKIPEEGSIDEIYKFSSMYIYIYIDIEKGAWLSKKGSWLV